jgi:hypothetical protein
MRVFKGHHLAGIGFSVPGYIVLLRDLGIGGDFQCEARGISQLKQSGNACQIVLIASSENAGARSLGCFTRPVSRTSKTTVFVSSSASSDPVVHSLVQDAAYGTFEPKSDGCCSMHISTRRAESGPSLHFAPRSGKQGRFANRHSHTKSAHSP